MLGDVLVFEIIVRGGSGAWTHEIDMSLGTTYGRCHRHRLILFQLEETHEKVAMP